MNMTLGTTIEPSALVGGVIDPKPGRHHLRITHKIFR